MNEDIDFAMEVTSKSRSDTQGGVPILYENRPRLLEIAQVPKERIAEFTKSGKRFNLFNTNNLWVNLVAIKVNTWRCLCGRAATVIDMGAPSCEQNLLEAGKLRLDPIATHVTVNGEKCLQVETAAGSAIQVS